MKNKNGIYVRYVRSNEAHDIFYISGPGWETVEEDGNGSYKYYPRGTTEEEVLNEFTQ